MNCPEYSLPPFEDDYCVNEIFQSIQGEGHWSGTPMTFLRLQGCRVQCAWCDTKHSWLKIPENERTLAQCLHKKDSDATWARANAETIFNLIHTLPLPIRKLLITGGEPAAYCLMPLCERFEAHGWQIFLETSGTEIIRGSKNMWVTVSPKFNMRGRNDVHDEALLRANEIKFVVARPADLQIFEKRLSTLPLPETTIISLQPVAQNPNILPFCVQAAMERNWQISLQLHKFLNIR